MMLPKTKLFLPLFLLLFLRIETVRAETITFDSDNCHVTLTFSPARIARAKVENAVRIRADENQWFLGEPDCLLIDTKSEKGYTAECERAILDKTDKIKRLRTLDIPPELAPAARYYIEYAEFTLSLDQAKRDYLKSHDVQALSARVGTVDAKTACAKEISAIAAMKDERAKLRGVAFEWHNCVNHAHHEPRYPAASWEKFLKAYGIMKAETCDENPV